MNYKRAIAQILIRELKRNRQMSKNGESQELKAFIKRWYQSLPGPHRMRLDYLTKVWKQRQ